MGTVGDTVLESESPEALSIAASGLWALGSTSWVSLGGQGGRHGSISRRCKCLRRPTSRLTTAGMPRRRSSLARSQHRLAARVRPSKRPPHRPLKAGYSYVRADMTLCPRLSDVTTGHDRTCSTDEARPLRPKKNRAWRKGLAQLTVAVGRMPSTSGKLSGEGVVLLRPHTMLSSLSLATSVRRTAQRAERVHCAINNLHLLHLPSNFRCALVVGDRLPFPP